MFQKEEDIVDIKQKKKHFLPPPRFSLSSQVSKMSFSFFNKILCFHWVHITKCSAMRHAPSYSLSKHHSFLKLGNISRKMSQIYHS